MFDLGPAAQEMSRLVSGVRDDQLDYPTPCPDWTVADLLAHVHQFATVFTHNARKEQARPPGDLVDDWRVAIPDQLDQLARAWRLDSAWQGRVSAGGVEMDAQDNAVVGIEELTMHGWDLARATHQDLHVDDARLDQVDQFFELFAEQIAAGEGPFGPPVRPPERATRLERIVACTGREPSWVAPLAPRKTPFGGHTAPDLGALGELGDDRSDHSASCREDCCPMALTTLDPAARHRAIGGRFTELVEGTTDWNAPAPVAGWTARDVVGHLIEWLPPLLAGGAGVALPSNPGVEDDPVLAWRVHVEGVQALLDDPTTPGLMLINPHIGKVPLDRAVDQFYTADVFQHTWDLARATGQNDRLDPDFCAALLAGMEPMDELLRSSGQYGPPVPTSRDADAQTRLIGFIGRDPFWTAP